jgi:hypothetical protein
LLVQYSVTYSVWNTSASRILRRLVLDRLKALKPAEPKGR